MGDNEMIFNGKGARLVGYISETYCKFYYRSLQIDV